MLLIFKWIFRTIKNSFGNIIEWYDFSLYGYFATIIAAQFFPSHDPWISLLAAFAAFGVGFIARPFGSFLFGYLGDKVGRHYAMNISITLMAISTVAMAFLPTWDHIGVLAPILLVCIRLLQGVSAGGQFGNLMTITAEDETLKYRGFSLAIAYSTSVIGFLIAAGVSYCVFSFLPKDAQAWAWRIPFVFGFLLLLIHIFLREDDKGEVNTAPREKTPTQILFSYYRWHLTLILILSVSASTLYYLVVTYLVTYMELELGLSLSSALGVSTISLVGLCITTPIFGFLSDIIGRKRFHIIAYIVMSLSIIPLVLLLQTDNLSLITLGVLLIAIATAITQGASTPYYTEIFPPQVRAIGCSIGFGFGAAISGFAPMLATYIMGVTTSTVGLCTLMIVTSLIGLIVAIIIPNHQAEIRRVNSIINAEETE
ncbi:MFS transporter [Francisella frigiditurris]